jgi:hypothetical protein
MYFIIRWLSCAALKVFTLRTSKPSLINPVELAALPALDLAVLEPEGDFLLAVDTVAAVADVAANVDGVSRLS